MWEDNMLSLSLINSFMNQYNRVSQAYHIYLTFIDLLVTVHLLIFEY